jgi:hypothetical protein
MAIFKRKVVDSENFDGLVAVVQVDEINPSIVVLLNNDVVSFYNGRGVVNYMGKTLPVTIGINDLGDVPDEKVFDGFESFKEFDKNAKPFPTEVTYSRPKFKFVPGRTVVGADVHLWINGVEVFQESYYEGKGSYVRCENGTIFRRFAFQVPSYVLEGTAKPSVTKRPKADS